MHKATALNQNWNTLVFFPWKPPLGVVFYSPLLGFSLLAYKVS